MNEVFVDLGTPNPIQQRANALFRAGKRIVLINTGRQGGKSHYGARWLLGRLKYGGKARLSLMVAPTFRQARVMQRKFEEVLMTDLRLYQSVRIRQQPIPTYTFPDGYTVEVHSADDPDSLRGLTADNVWFDEVALAAQAAFDIIMPTLLATSGYFLGTTTPRGKQNWTYRHLYLRAIEAPHPDYSPELYDSEYGVVIGSTKENAANLSEAAIRLLETQYGIGSSFGRQEIEGEFVTYEGLVYDWSEERDYIAPTKLPPIDSCSLVLGGLDFGWFPDPTAAYILGYKEGIWYVYDGLYENKLLTNDLATELQVLGERYKPIYWVADSARPDEIADLNARGIPVRAVKKPEIVARIREMSMFANHNRFKVSWSVPDVKNELQTYEYPSQEKLERAAKPNPQDKNNHAMDAIGYALWSVRYLWATNNSYSSKPDEKPDMKDPYEEAMMRAEQNGGDYAGLYSR